MKNYLAILLLGFSAIVKSQIPNFQWAGDIGGAISDQAKSVIYDNSGNVLVSGTYFGAADFDPGPFTNSLSSRGMNDVFVTKLDPSGLFLWSASMGGTLGDVVAEITTNTLGDVFVSGNFSASFYPSVTLPGFVFTSAGSTDVFVNKLNSSGNYVWSRQIARGSGNASATSICLDALGNIYISGNFDGTADFDPGAAVVNLTATGSDAFVCKLNSGGNFVWAKNFGGPVGDWANSVKVGPSGNVFIGGRYSQTSDFDPGIGTFTMTAFAGSGEAFINVLDANGNFLFAKSLAEGFSSTESEVVDIVLDPLGNINALGNFYGTIDANPGPGVSNLVSNGGKDVFVNKLTSTGSFVWAKSIGGPNDDVGNSIVLDTSRNIFFAGSYKSVVDFNPGPATNNFTPVGFEDGFLDVLDASGNFIFAGSFGGSFTQESATSVIVDSLSNVYLAGGFGNTVDFDPSSSTYTLASQGSLDAFVMKMNLCIAPPPPVNTTPFANLNVCENVTTTLTASGTGTVNWYYFSSTVPFYSGTTYTANSGSAGTGTLYIASETCMESLTKTPIVINVNVCTGINEMQISNNSIVCYPNPSNGSLNLTFSERGTYSIINSIGQVMQTIEVMENSQTINVNGLEDGMYYVAGKSSKAKIVVIGNF